MLAVDARDFLLGPVVVEPDVLDRALMDPEAISRPGVTSTAPGWETIKTINIRPRTAQQTSTNPRRLESPKQQISSVTKCLTRSSLKPTERGVPCALMFIEAGLVVGLGGIAKRRPQCGTLSKISEALRVLARESPNLNVTTLTKDRVSLVGAGAIPTIQLGLLLL